MKTNMTKNNEHMECENIVRKKGRPRKVNVTDHPEPESLEPEPKKRRGRKKKEPSLEEPQKLKKKRGRKAAVKYFSSSIRKQIPLTTVIQEKDNFILHLDVKDAEQEAFAEQQVTYDNVDLKKSVLQQIQLEYSQTDIDFNEIESQSTMYLLEEKIKDRFDQDQVIVTKLENMHITISEDSGLSSSDNEEDSRIQGYFNVLGDFVSNNDWLKRCNVWCWWCCHPFDTVPIGLPVHYDDKTKKFRVKGVFCSFSCSVAYKKTHYHKHSNIDQLIKSLYKHITGSLKFESTLLPAPPQQSLKCFGGQLSIEEFRNMTKENKVFKMIEYPMFVSRDYIEEIDIKNVKNANTTVFTDFAPREPNTLDTKRIYDAKVRLQSQIDKTTIISGNTIDKFIDIL